MASQYSPKIVTNGLVLALDAANKKSYSGTGTSWIDLSGNNNVGTLVNSPTYTNDNNGSILFDGVNTSINIPHDSNSMDFSLAQTICMWLRPNSLASTNPLNQAYGGPGTIRHLDTGGFIYYFGTNGGNGTPWTSRNSVFTVTSNEIAFITVTRNQVSNQVLWYKNGILQQSSDAASYETVANGTNPIILGDGFHGNFDGDIFYCFVYNEALSSTEILQNYNATKSRFGL